MVQPGKVLMVLSPSGETQLVLQIDERNLAKLKLGQKALASADAYPAQRFAAELVYINPGRRRAARHGRGEAPGARCRRSICART